MSPAATQWIGPVLVLVFGAVLGAGLLLASRRSRAAGELPRDLSTDDLNERLESLLHQLREIGPPLPDDSADRTAERNRIERQAARVLRELDAVRAATAASAVVPPEAVAVAPASRAATRLMWFTGTVTVAAVLYVLLLQFSAPRADPDAPMTGALPTQGAQPPAAVGDDPEVKRLEALARATPGNLELRNDLARRYLETRQLMNVFIETQYVLERQPSNPRALAYQSLVRLAMGEKDEALQMLQRALQADPNSLDAWLHMSIVQMELGNPEAAMNALDVASKRHPGQAAFLAQVKSALSDRIASDKGGATPAAESHFAGTLVVPAGTDVPRGALVFVTIRPAGATTGAPLAAKRIVAAAFPLGFSVSPADSMQGGALPPTARIEARVDSDGNPLTRDPADPAGFIDGVKLGAKDLKIELRRP